MSYTMLRRRRPVMSTSSSLSAERECVAELVPPGRGIHERVLFVERERCRRIVLLVLRIRLKKSERRIGIENQLACFVLVSHRSIDLKNKSGHGGTEVRSEPEQRPVARAVAAAATCLPTYAPPHLLLPACAAAHRAAVVSRPLLFARTTRAHPIAAAHRVVAAAR